MLWDTRAAPMMYALCEEAMLMRTSTLLEVAGVEFSCTEFYSKHGGRDGAGLLLKRPDGMSFDDWTHKVVDDALMMLEAKYG